MKFLLFCLYSGLALTAHAGQWTTLVEELAERAAGTEVRGAGERAFVFRESEDAARLFASQARGVSSPDAALLRRFQRLPGVDTALLQKFRGLPPAEWRATVELGEGVQQVLRRYPGPEGERLLQHLDTAGLAQGRTYGDFVADGLYWLESDEALEALRLPMTPETRAGVARALGLSSAPAELGEAEVASLWKSTVRKTGDGAGQFWRTYVAPHKGKWLVGGLLVTYLAMPETFHDATGKLTEYGTREVGKLLGDTVLGAGRGFFGGLGTSLNRQYAEAPVRTVITLGIVAGLLLIAIPRIRWLVWHLGLRRLLCGPAQKKASSGETKHRPLQE